MTDASFFADLGDGPEGGLELSVGCESHLDAPQAVEAVVQVAPCPQPGVRIEREQWHAGGDHHGYLDHYANRCERFAIETGRTSIAHEARLWLTDPADVPHPDAPETPVASLPDETLSFVMPSRFCLPDELGHEAWQRFGDAPPGWGRVPAIVYYVHGYLEFVAGASNP